MALFMTSEDIAYACSFISQWSSFPTVPIDESSFIPKFAVRHWVMGCLLLAIAVTDYFTFYNYPMQRNIILARTERSLSENHKLIEIS